MNAAQHDTSILPGDAAPRDADALPKNARLQNGAFEVHAILGRGGQGITYRAMDISLQRVVAIKEFFPPGSMRKGDLVAPTMAEAEFFAAREKFGQQARLPARFNHESIARIFRVFEENQSAYMVMEFLEGQTLGEKLKTRALPVDEAAQIATRIAAALSVVHDAQLLHSAVCPDNIFLTKNQRAVLVDFISAREIAQTSHTGTVAAQRGYAPIEQYGDQSQVGPPTDIYGLGATLYHALCGHAPASAPDRLAGIDLISPEKINPQISPALSRVVMHALEIQAANRTQTAREFSDELKKALQDASDSGFALAPHFSPIPRTSPTALRSTSAPRTPAAPTRGAATVALPHSAALPDLSERVEQAGSTPSLPPLPRGAAPTVPQSTPTPPPGVQMCPHCHNPMPAVMMRCPHCKQSKHKASGDQVDGAFSQWRRNENTRIGLGWALAIGFTLLILFALAGGLSSIGLRQPRAPQTERIESFGVLR